MVRHQKFVMVKVSPNRNGGLNESDQPTRWFSTHAQSEPFLNEFFKIRINFSTKSSRLGPILSGYWVWRHVTHYCRIFNWLQVWFTCEWRIWSNFDENSDGKGDFWTLSAKILYYFISKISYSKNNFKSQQIKTDSLTDRRQKRSPKTRQVEILKPREKNIKKCFWPSQTSKIWAWLEFLVRAT